MKYWMISPDARSSALITFYQIGYEKHLPTGKFGPYVRDYYLIHYIVNGGGTLEKENTRYSLKKGNLFLIKPGEVTTYWADPANPYEYYWIGFNGPRCEELIKSMGFINNNPVVENEHLEEIQELFNKAYHDVGELSIKEYLNLYETMFNILSYFCKDNIYYKNKFYDTDVIKNATMFIEHNYMNQISVDDIAKSISLSRSQTYRLFIKNYGVSPGKYLIDFRLNKADHLILTTNYSISEISFLSGFNNYSYFVSSYKKKNGKTPQEKRKYEKDIKNHA